MTTPIDKINLLRAKVRDGEELTQEEAREALEALRAQRKSVLDAQTTREKKTKAPANLNDLFE